MGMGAIIAGAIVLSDALELNETIALGVGMAVKMIAMAQEVYQVTSVTTMTIHAAEEAGGIQALTMDIDKEEAMDDKMVGAISIQTEAEGLTMNVGEVRKLLCGLIFSTVQFPLFIHYLLLYL